MPVPLDLEAVRLFGLVVERGSIRAAAAAAGLEPSSVSRRVTALERRLGAKLVERSAGPSRPTQAGLAYHERMRGVLDHVAAIEAEVAGEAEVPRGLLRVSAAIDFGQRFVAGWLLDFRARWPEVEVDLALSARNVDLVATGTDVAIRSGEQPDSALMARRLSLVPRRLYAAPELVERFGTPTAPADLVGMPHVFFLPEHRRRPLRLSDGRGGTIEVARTGGVTMNAVQSVVQAVVAGHGVHLGPAWAFEDAFAAGRVVELLPEHAPPPTPLYAVWSPAVVVPARVRLFVGHAARAARATFGDAGSAG